MKDYKNRPSRYAPHQQVGVERLIIIIHNLCAALLFIGVFSMLAVVLTGCSEFRFKDGPIEISHTRRLTTEKIEHVSITTPDGRVYKIDGYTDDQTETARAVAHEIAVAITGAKP